MIASSDLLYLVLALCILAITGMMIAIGVQVLQILRDIERISRNVEEMTVLVEKVAQVIFPGLERVAKRADTLEQKVASFIEKKVDKIIH